MHSVEYYVNKIGKKSPKVKYIHLTNKHLSDADLAPLFAAFEQNPDALQYIHEIHLNGNELKVLKLRGFSALRKLHVAHNQLYELELEDLPAITHLYASNNRLHFVEIDHLTTLRVASFVGNSLVATHIKDLLVLNKLGLQGNDLSLATKIALKAINLQTQNLKIEVSHENRKRRINELYLPRIDEVILRLHFKRLYQNLYPPETLDFLFTVAFVLNTIKGKTIPTDAIGIIADFLLPRKYFNAFDRSVAQLRAAFTRRINEVHVVNPPPLRRSSALSILNQYTNTNEFTELRGKANHQSTWIVMQYSAGIQKVRQDKLVAEQKNEVVIPQSEPQITKVKRRKKVSANKLR